MVYVVSVKEVKDRMVLSEYGDGTDAIVSAISASQSRMESELDTRFEKTTNTDVFFLNKSMHGGITPNGFFRCRLRNGMVRDDPDISVKYGNGSVESLGEDVTSVVIDRLRGIVHIPEVEEGEYVTVSYTSGYTQDEIDDTDLEKPSWLRESVLGYVPVIFNASQSTNRKDSAEKGYRMAGDHALAVLAPYRRNIGFCLRPLF